MPTVGMLLRTVSMSWAQLRPDPRPLFEVLPWRRYVAMGDSITEGLGDPVPGYPTVSWAQSVADALATVRPDFEFVNLARRDLTTAEIRSTQLEQALELEPDLVSLIAGGNDLIVEEFDPLPVERELEATIAALAETDATVVTGTMFNITAAGLLPRELNDGLRERLRALSQVVRRVARRYAVLLVDFWSHPASADPGIYSADLQHANMRGHAIAADVVLHRLAEHAAGMSAAEARC
jgi:lysophospholipase L1-like esterase